MQELVMRMDKTPFYKDRSKRTKNDIEKKSIKFPKRFYKDLNKYFKSEGFEDFSEGIRHLCQEALDGICPERKTFNQLEVIMLIPKTDDIDELEAKSRIISIINTECDFDDDYVHDGFNEQYNLTYPLTDFKKTLFPFGTYANLKESKVYRTNIRDLKSWNAFKIRQNELYSLNVEEDESLNLNDCYFVNFPLNNYLDIYDNGRYHDDSFEYAHHGVFIFRNYFDNGRFLFCNIGWEYSPVNDSIVTEFYFQDRDDFIMQIFDYKDKDGKADDRLIQCLKDSDSHDMESLRRLRNVLKANVGFLDKIIDG